ncbi:type I methionyl aminopeptidase [Yaniella flava]|uniref:Methionine aminopeptidase n=1 Tax=Yaniella flava TaxID=287930 RepID=A0ABP5FLW9_9MICC|nr:type I methionyl aminopeptidase [Micrococcaceae bacterium]
MSRQIELKSNAQMATMHQAGLILHQGLDEVVAAAKPGVTTAQLDEVFRKVLSDHGATSNFLGYYGFPATICASVNDEVVHGIPGERVLQDGDVISVDAGAIIDGWHSDSARTVLVGKVDAADQRLSEVTEEAMWAGIAAFAKAKHVGEIGNAIEDSVRAQEGATFGILEDYVGHGIGSAMHQAPDVFNYRSGMRGPRVKAGMVLAIEPMLVRGDIATKTLADNWTVVTVDGANASQWEHSVARHKEGIWVTTAPDGGASRLERYGVTPVPIPQN